MNVRIPHLDLQDRLVGHLTARQLGILAIPAFGLWVAWRALGSWVSPTVFGMVAVPLAGAAIALALTRRDGLSLDRFLLAALGYRLRTRTGVPPGGDALPGIRRPRTPSGPTVEALTPARVAGRGAVVDLGPEGVAVLAVVSTTNLALRTVEEQDAVIAGFAAWLNSLSGPVQWVIRALPVDLSGQIHRVRATAARLPHPALTHAALDHAAHLAQIAAQRQPLRRQCLLILRDPHQLPTPATGSRVAPEDPRGYHANARAITSRLTRRVQEATSLLGAAGLTVTPLDATQARAVLAATRPTIPNLQSRHCAPAPARVRARAGQPRPSGPPRQENTPGLGRPVRQAPEHTAPPPAGVGVVVGAAPRYLLVDTPGPGGGCQREMVAVFAVAGYPAEVRDCWLDPLFDWPGRIEVSVHVDPVDPVTAATRLRHRQARWEADRRLDAQRGRLPDPGVDAAVGDAAELVRQIVTGQSRLFQVALYIAVYASGREGNSLAHEVSAVRAVASSLLVDAPPVTWRQPEAWRASVPIGVDRVRAHRTLHTAAVASMFPFNAPDTAPADPASAAAAEGVWWGHQLTGHGLVHHNRWQGHNYNTVVLARSGAGKSYLVKLDLLRSLYTGVRGLVIDPDDEYTRLTRAVGGRVVRLGAPGVGLNPLALPIHTGPGGTRHAPVDALQRARLTAQTVLDMLIGPHNPLERAVLDAAVAATYTTAKITDDPATWTRPAPLLTDLATTLTHIDPTTASGEGHAHTGSEMVQTARALAARLGPYVRDGAHASLFTPTGASASFPGHGDGPLGHDEHLISYSLRALPLPLRPVATLLVLDQIWGIVTDPGLRCPRLVVIDEAWALLGHPQAGDYLARAVRSARKYWAGITLATQDVDDVLGTQRGRTVVLNAATQVLLRQAPQALDQVCALWRLTNGERALLVRAEHGQGLVCDGDNRIGLAVTASPTEDSLIRTDPAYLAELAEHNEPDILTLPPTSHPTTPATAAGAAAATPGGAAATLPAGWSG